MWRAVLLAAAGAVGFMKPIVEAGSMQPNNKPRHTGRLMVVCPSAVTHCCHQMKQWKEQNHHHEAQLKKIERIDLTHHPGFPEAFSALTIPPIIPKASLLFDASQEPPWVVLKECI